MRHKEAASKRPGRVLSVDSGSVMSEPDAHDNVTPAQSTFRAARARIPELYTRLHAIRANPLPHPEAENLRQRVLDPKRDYHRLFTFLKINHMPPTNNHAERTLRQPALFRKNVFGSRSGLDANALAINFSILHTAQCQKLAPIPILTKIAAAHRPSASRLANIPQPLVNRNGRATKIRAALLTLACSATRRRPGPAGMG